MPQKILSPLILLVLLASCQKLEASRGPAAPAPTQAMPPATAEAAPADPLASGQPAVTDVHKIIRNAELRFRTDDYAGCRAAVVEAVSRHGGYLASEQEENSGWALHNTMVLRVPANHLDALLADLATRAAFVESRTVTAQDVTEQFVDLEARLRAKHEVEVGYRRLLDRAAKVEEILAIERELRVVQEEIEAAEGRLRYLSSQVDYSTVNLVFHQDLPGPEDPDRGLWHQIWEALTTGVEWLVQFFVGLLYVWPFLLAGALIVWWLSRRRRRRRA